MVISPGADKVAVVEWAEVLVATLVVVVVVLDGRPASRVLLRQYWEVSFKTTPGLSANKSTGMKSISCQI